MVLALESGDADHPRRVVGSAREWLPAEAICKMDAVADAGLGRTMPSASRRAGACRVGSTAFRRGSFQRQAFEWVRQAGPTTELGSAQDIWRLPWLAAGSFIDLDDVLATPGPGCPIQPP